MNGAKKTFTQDEVNEIVEERLARERGKRPISQEDIDRIVKERLTRQKEGYEKEIEQLQVRITQLEGEKGEQPSAEHPQRAEEGTLQLKEEDKEQAEYKAKYLGALKEKALLNAGINPEDIEKYFSYVPGEDAEAIEQSATELAKELQQKPSYADPSGAKQKRGSSWNPFGK